MIHRRRPARETRWTCVFSSGFIREAVDPLVQRKWQERYGKGAPFGNLRRIFRQEHCATINPYGSDSCPYRERDCGLAFYQCVSYALDRHETDPVGFFRAVARSRGLDRADNRPLPREREDATQRPGDKGAASESADEGRGLHRSASRPVAIRDLLGALDLGPREGRTEDGEAGAE